MIEFKRQEKQTAMQWLLDAMNGHLSDEDLKSVINMGLQLERKQIEEAYLQGDYDFFNSPSKLASDYYNENYNFIQQ